MNNLQILKIKYSAVLELLQKLYQNLHNIYVEYNNATGDEKDKLMNEYFNYNKCVSDIQNEANILSNEIDEECKRRLEDDK